MISPRRRPRRAGRPGSRAGAADARPRSRRRWRRPAAIRAGREPPRRASTSAAEPAVSAQTRATPIPTTSSRPKPWTIGTGESSRTRKPVAVASAAVAIVGAARPAAWATAVLGGERARVIGPACLLGARLELDAVVDSEPDQDRQHRHRGQRQRRAEHREQTERDPGRGERDREREQPQPALEHDQQGRRHNQQDGDQHAGDRARDRAREVMQHDRLTGHGVRAVVGRAEHRHRDRLPDPADRLRLLSVGERGPQPDLDQGRVGRREQVGEARLGLIDPLGLVIDDLGDELRRVDRGQRRDAGGHSELLEGLVLLLLLELARGLGRRRGPLGAEVLADRQLVGGALRAAHGGADTGQHRLDLGVDRRDRAVEEGARSVDDLGGPVARQLAARAAGAAVGSVGAGERERPQSRARHRVLTGEARLELGQGGEIPGLQQVGQRLVDQHDHGVLTEMPLVGDGRLIADRGFGDERVDPRRRLERQGEQRAAQGEHGDDRERDQRPSRCGADEPLEPLSDCHRYCTAYRRLAPARAGLMRR